MPLLTADGITVRHTGAAPSRGEDRSPVIDRFDLQLEAGELRAVVGPSGSGKTTLLRALTGLLPLERGDITLEGRSIRRWEPAAYRRAVGMLPQRPVMFGGSVADNLRYPATLRSAARGRAHPDEAELLAAVGLEPSLAERPAADLSEGQANRVGLVRALCAGPTVLLLDEPTAALDDAAADLVQALLERLAGEGMAILWVLHDSRRAGTLPGDPVLHTFGSFRGARRI